MKKIIIALLILAFVFTLPVCAEDVLDIGRLARFEVNDCGLWVACNDELRLYDFDNSLVFDVFTGEINNFCTDSGSAYLLETKNGVQRILRITADGTAAETWPLPEGMAADDLAVCPDCFYLVIPCEDQRINKEMIQMFGQNRSLFRMDRATGECIRVPDSDWFQNIRISEITSNDDYVFAYSDVEDNLFMLKAADAVPVSSVMCTEGSCFSAGSEDTVYCLINGQKLTRYDMQSSYVTNVTTVEPAYGIAVRDGLLYSFDVNTKCISRAPLPDTGSDQLVICMDAGSTPRFAKAVEMFNAKYPDTTVVINGTGDSRILANSLMSGEDLYDLIMVWEHGAICTKQMAKVGAIDDLSAYPGITANLEKWLDISSVICMDDFLMGVPMDILPYMFLVNEDLLAESGLTLPEGRWSWDDFFAMAQKLLDEGSTVCLLSDYPYPYLCKQYDDNNIDIMNGVAEYDTELYRSLIEKWKYYVDNGIICSDHSKPAIFTFTEASYQLLGDNTFLLPPITDDSAKYPVSTYTYVMNTNSSRKEKAAYFLECYISEEALNTTPYFYSNKLLAGRPEHLTDPDLAASLPFALTTEEEDDLWNYIMENATMDFFYSDLQREMVNDLFPAYMNGDISLDQYIFTLSQKADMALGE